MSGQVGTKLMNTYVQVVLDAGGIPLLIPNYIPEKHLREMLQQFDGLLLTGGGISIPIAMAVMHMRAFPSSTRSEIEPSSLCSRQCAALPRNCSSLHAHRTVSWKVLSCQDIHSVWVCSGIPRTDACALPGIHRFGESIPK
jgi:hypothetical protein